jgi:outer membrane protein assembly factor BamB
VVVALNGQGKTLWTSPGDLEPGAVLNRPVLADVNEDGVSDVILPTVDKGLVALDGTRGWKLWDTAGMTRGKMITTPVKADINGDKTADFIGVTDAGQVLAVTGRDGKVWQIWEAEVAPVYYASPLLVDTGERNLVVIATDGGGIVALDAASGRSIWSADVKNRFFASPVAADANGDGVPDVVAVAENGDIHLLNGLTGREIWSSALGVGVQGSPALFDMNNDELADLVLLDLTGKIQVIDIARGGVLMTREVPGAGTFVASPVLADLNNDQLVEIVTAGQSGVITSFAVNRTIRRGHAAWPMFLGNDRHGLE